MKKNVSVSIQLKCNITTRVINLLINNLMISIILDGEFNCVVTLTFDRKCDSEEKKTHQEI
jgi:hypothetical protein